MAAGLGSVGWEDVREIPLADGGEGTLDAVLAARAGTRLAATVTDPLGQSVEASWALMADGAAVIEMAQASGLRLVEGRNDPLAASTRGTGELMMAAISAGARRLLVTVGGSATTDGGLGAVEALGWSLHGVEVTVACDVTIHFVRAAHLFAPQKGAGPDEVRVLQDRLERLAGEYVRRTGVDVTTLAGSGAAGGLAGGLAALGARLRRGFDVVAEAVGLSGAVDGSALVVTGEGRLDQTSMQGKVVGGVLDLAEAHGVSRRAVIAGQMSEDIRERLPRDVLALALVDRSPDPEASFTRAAELVQAAAAEIGRWAQAPRSGGHLGSAGPRVIEAPWEGGSNDHDA